MQNHFVSNCRVETVLLYCVLGTYYERVIHEMMMMIMTTMTMTMTHITVSYALFYSVNAYCTSRLPQHENRSASTQILSTSACCRCISWTDLLSYCRPNSIS